MEVAVLGLGEAGGRIAADLVDAGCAVRGWDPARQPEGIVSADSAQSAVEGAEVVLSVNAAAVALDVAAAVASCLREGALYADLNTSAPELKRRAGRGRADPVRRRRARRRRPHLGPARRRRSHRVPAPSGSPSSSGRSACPSSSSACVPATRRD